MKDHAIPVGVLRNMLFAAQPQTPNGVREFLRSYYRIGVITVAEHTYLAAVGMSSRMPDGWQQGDSPFARYERADIVAQDLGDVDQ